MIQSIMDYGSSICTPRNPRCEICKVKSLEGGVGFNAPFLWNGMNYLLKIPHDMDFLNKCEPLREYLGPRFPLVRNPFSMVHDLDDILTEQKESSKFCTACGAKNSIKFQFCISCGTKLVG